MNTSEIVEQLAILCRSYDSLRLVSCHSEIEADKLSDVLQVLNIRFNDLLLQLRDSDRGVDNSLQI